MPVPVQNAEYYSELAKEDYYSQGGERPGYWIGAGAEKLGLGSKVDPKVFANLLRGLSPDGSKELVRLVRGQKHCQAWDVCLSAVKDLSVLQALSKTLDRVYLETAHQEGVLLAAKYISENVMFTRRGAGGRRLEACDPIIAAFRHFTNRNGEPQTHDHLIILNMGVSRTDGAIRTIVSKFLYDHQIAIIRVYLTGVAIALRRDMGLKLEPVEGRESFTLGDSFRIAGVPKKLIDIFSTRRAQVLAAMVKAGTSGPRAAELAALATRQVKGHVALEVLKPHWSRLAERIGVGDAEINAILAPSRQHIDRFSTRRAEIDPAMSTAGTSGPRAAESAALATRETKGPDTDINVIFPPSRHNQESPSSDANSASMPPDSAEVRQTVQTPRLHLVNSDNRATSERENAGETSKRQKSSEVDSTEQLQETVIPSERPTRTDSKLEGTANRVHVGVLEQLILSVDGGKEPSRAVYNLIDHVLDQYDRKHPPYAFTDPKERAAEATEAHSKLLPIVEKLRGSTRHLIPSERLKEGPRGPLQGKADDVAFERLLTGTGAIACVHAGGGIDDRLFIASAANAYEKMGMKVRVYTPNATAAVEIESASGIKTNTVGQFMYHTAITTGEQLAHQGRQMLRALFDKSTVNLKDWTWRPDNVIFVTDSQLLRSVEILKLLRAAETTGAKVVFLGDPNQTVRREPQNAFTTVQKACERITLTESARPIKAWETSAIQQIAIGDIRGGMTQFILNGRVHAERDQRSAAVALIDHWKSLKPSQRTNETLIIASGDREAKVLNALAQRAMRDIGERGLLMRKRVDGGWMYRGDRIKFVNTANALGYRSGDRGTIERIKFDSIRVRLDRKTTTLGFEHHVRVDVPSYLYRTMKLGYALTPNEARGLTARQALVLPKHGLSDRAGLLVQLSRVTEGTRVFTTQTTMAQHLEEPEILAAARGHREENRRHETETQRHEKQARSLRP